MVAEVCNLHLPIGHTVGDIEYYINKLQGIDGKILEVACGTGRVIVPLLKAGFDIEGLDYCPGMLEVCKKNCQERKLDPILHHHNMINFKKLEYYSAILIPAGSIRNIDGYDDTRSALKSFYNSLKPDGLLLVDLIAPRFIIALGPMQYWEKDPYLWTTELLRQDYDPLANRTFNFVRYQKWQDGELLKTELHRSCLQHWGLDEFAQLLTKVGFTDINIIADFKENSKPKSGSADWTFIAKKP